MTDAKILTYEISKIDPQARKPEDQAELLLIAKKLGAVDKTKAVRTRQLEDEGVKKIALSRARKNNLMEKSTSHRAGRFILDERTRSWLTTENEIKSALVRERAILYGEIESNGNVKSVVAEKLGLDRNVSVTTIRAELESGDLWYRQVSNFDGVIQAIHIILGKLHTQCRRIGWRTAPHYWNLTEKAKKLLEALENA